MSAEGWTWLINSPKWHYFRGGRSLCRRFALFANPAEGFAIGDDGSPDNCKACRNALEKTKTGGAP